MQGRMSFREKNLDNGWIQIVDMEGKVRYEFRVDKVKLPLCDRDAATIL